MHSNTKWELHKMEKNNGLHNGYRTITLNYMGFAYNKENKRLHSGNRTITLN